MWATWNAPPEKMISLSSVDWKSYAGHMQGLWQLMETWLSLTWTPWSSRQSPLRRVILSLMKNECKTSHNHTLCEPKTKRTALLKQGRKLEGADVYLDEQRSAYTARQGHILRKQHGYQIVKHSKKGMDKRWGPARDQRQCRVGWIHGMTTRESNDNKRLWNIPITNHDLLIKTLVRYLQLKILFFNTIYV